MIIKKLSNIKSSKRRVFHPYFTSQPHNVVSEYIKYFSKNDDVILDPYVGSGVTLLESRLLKRKSIGIDLSSFACFISEVSTEKYENIDDIKNEFENLKKRISGNINSHYNTNENKVSLNSVNNILPENIDLPSNSDVKKLYELFTKRNLVSLAILLDAINNTNDYKIRKLFLGIFSGILHRASRTFFYDKLKWGGGNSGIFTKYRYWVPKNPNERNVWELFEIRFKRILPLINKLNCTFPDDYKPTIIKGSATNMNQIKKESIDYIYTDPPYGGNINYLELSTIWRAWLKLPIGTDDSLLEVIEGGELQHSEEHYIKYLKDSIKEMFRVLKYDKRLSIAFSHKNLSFWYNILEGCQDAGFEYVNTLYYSSYYNTYHKIRNPLRVLSGQMVLNFKKIKKPRKIKYNGEQVELDKYILDKVKYILTNEGDVSTEEIFNKLIPQLLEKGLLRNYKNHIDVVKILEKEFLFNSSTNKWTIRSSILEEVNNKISCDKKYDLILFHFPVINSEYELKLLDSLVRGLDHVLSDTGILWITVNHQIMNNKIVEMPFLLTEKLKFHGLSIKNIITWIKPNKKKHLFNNYYSHCLFVTKSNKNHYFSKDPIREKHIWKDVEWGKRKFRYNKKGKDPGNVWLPTEDDGKGHITKHMILDEFEKNKRIILCSAKANSEVLYIGHKLKNDIKNYCNKKKILLQIIKYKNKNKEADKLDLDITNNAPPKSNDDIIQHRIIFYTSENMKHLKNKTIKLVVTSPPYWDLKNYENEKQIGCQEAYEKYLRRLEIVWKECKRVLRDDGSIWININSRAVKGQYFGIQNDIIASMKKLGFKLLEIVVWHKSSGIPVNEKNLTDRFEYILGFTKSNLKKINIQKISFQDYLICKKYEEPINVWNMNRPSGSIAKGVPHPAMYPEELPRRLIKLLTGPGDIVLDPFLGSGSTVVAAIKENRSSVGYELNVNYKKIISIKVNKEKKNLFSYQQKIDYIED